MCAGVQNVSRPIDWCHEMSHIAPSGMHVAPKTMTKQYQGTEIEVVVDFAASFSPITNVVAFSTSKNYFRMFDRTNTFSFPNFVRAAIPERFMFVIMVSTIALKLCL